MNQLNCTPNPRPMRAFQVSLRSVSGCHAYTVMANSSIDAMTSQLDCYDGELPVGASVKPINQEQFDRVLAKRMSLSGLVEGVEYV